MQLLPGFRDFYPEDCARRNYIIAVWREVARRYGGLVDRINVSWWSKEWWTDVEKELRAL